MNELDDTLPVDTTVIPVGYVQADAAITLTATDSGDQSGVATIYYQVDSGAPNVASSGDVIHITANGAHVLKIRVVDNAGNDSGFTTRIVPVSSTCSRSPSIAPTAPSPRMSDVLTTARIEMRSLTTRASTLSAEPGRRCASCLKAYDATSAPDNVSKTGPRG